MRVLALCLLLAVGFMAHSDETRVIQVQKGPLLTPVTVDAHGNEVRTLGITPEGNTIAFGNTFDPRTGELGVGSTTNATLTLEEQLRLAKLGKTQTSSTVFSNPTQSSLGGIDVATQTLSIPGQSSAEATIAQVLVQLALQQLIDVELTADLRAQVAANFGAEVAALGEEEAFRRQFITPQTVAEQAQVELESRRRTDSALQRLSQLQLEAAEGGFAPTEAQLANIRSAADAAIAIGESDIKRFTGELQQQISREVAPGLGLRPTDTPVVSRLGEVAEEGARQQGQLVRGIRGQEAQARLNFPLQSFAATSGLRGQEQGARAFQADLQQRAFLNRLALQPQSAALNFNPAGSLQTLQAPRLAQGTVQSQGSSLDKASQIFGLASQVGSALGLGGDPRGEEGGGVEILGPLVEGAKFLGDQFQNFFFPDEFASEAEFQRVSDRGGFDPFEGGFDSFQQTSSDTGFAPFDFSL